MQRNWLLAGLAVLFFALATFYSLATPAWEAPDEDAHYAFILHLRKTGALPIQKVDAVGAAHHAPLYYWVASLATLPVPTSALTQTFPANPQFIWHGHGSEINYVRHTTAEEFPYAGPAAFLHLARMVSVLMATATIVFIVLTGWEIFPAWPTVGLLAGILTACNPQFLFISGAINNDNLLVLATTVVVWQMMRTLRTMDSWRSWLWLGLWTAIGALAKISGLVLLGWTGPILLIDSVRRRAWASLVRRATALGAPVLLGIGWWLVRNQQLYGDPLGWTTYRSIFVNNARQSPLTLADIQAFFTTQYHTFWASFGWTTIDAPAWYYAGISLLCGIGVFGLAVFLFTRLDSLSHQQRVALACLGWLIVLYEGYMLWSIRVFDGSFYQGRYIFGLMVALNLFLSLGLHAVVEFRRPAVLVGVLGLVLLAIAIYMPIYVIMPAYR